MCTHSHPHTYVRTHTHVHTLHTHAVHIPTPHTPHTTHTTHTDTHHTTHTTHTVHTHIPHTHTTHRRSQSMDESAMMAVFEDMLRFQTVQTGASLQSPLQQQPRSNQSYAAMQNFLYSNSTNDTGFSPNGIAMPPPAPMVSMRPTKDCPTTPHPHGSTATVLMNNNHSTFQSAGAMAASSPLPTSLASPPPASPLLASPLVLSTPPATATASVLSPLHSSLGSALECAVDGKREAKRRKTTNHGSTTRGGETLVVGPVTASMKQAMFSFFKERAVHVTNLLVDQGQFSRSGPFCCEKGQSAYRQVAKCIQSVECTKGGDKCSTAHSCEDHKDLGVNNAVFIKNVMSWQKHQATTSQRVCACDTQDSTSAAEAWTALNPKQKEEYKQQAGEHAAKTRKKKTKLERLGAKVKKDITALIKSEKKRNDEENEDRCYINTIHNK
jgi:hypothetical protein